MKVVLQVLELKKEFRIITLNSHIVISILHHISFGGTFKLTKRATLIIVLYFRYSEMKVVLVVVMVKKIYFLK